MDRLPRASFVVSGIFHQLDCHVPLASFTTLLISSSTCPQCCFSPGPSSQSLPLLPLQNFPRQSNQHP